MAHMIENKRFRAVLAEKGESLDFSLCNKPDGKTWGPVPMAVLEVYDRMTGRAETVRSYRVMAAETIASGLHVTIRDVFHGITVGIWFCLDDRGDLTITVPPAEVKHTEDVLYRLFAVQIVPGLMTVGSDGEFLLPLNTGVVARPADKPTLRDRFLIYGEQERWELMPTLPICAVQTPQGGLAAIATSCPHDMYCDVATDGQGGGQIGLYPMFRRTWIDPVDWTERSVRFAALDPGDDIVVTSAKLLRRHVVGDLGKPTLKQRADESARCAYQQTAFTMKIFHGIQQQGIQMFGRESDPNDLLFQRCLTFEEAATCFHRLKKAGLDRVYLQSVGWNPKGHDGAWPTCFPIDRRFGGEAGLRDMVRTAKDLGYEITTHLNCSGSYFSSPDYVADHVLHDVWGEPRVTGFWGGGVKTTHWGLALPDGWLERYIEAINALGFNGMQYLDGMGNPLYVNYHPRNGGPRADFAAGVNRYLDTAKAICGAVQTETGYLYCALHADAVCRPASPWHLEECWPEWPVTALLEKRVPLWNLVVSGLVTHENTDLSWRGVMQSLLLGSVPRDEWCLAGTVHPVLTEERIGQLKAKYDLCCDRFGHLITEELTNWTPLDDHVETSRFADGTEVTADFENLELTVNDERIPCPEVLEPTS